MTKQSYRYRHNDFIPPIVRVEHMNIHLSFLDKGIVEGVNILKLTPEQKIERLVLDATDLEIKATELVQESGKKKEQPLTHDYNNEKNKLEIELGRAFVEGETFEIKTRTFCTPSDCILEGIYKDTTPPGCPQQYMSQCQQWGFQRIVPAIDRCIAKCTMTTTIEADARYTHLISNGNVNLKTNPDGIPVPLHDDSSRQTITYENPVPMAPYLFIAAAGTWDVLEDNITYPSGKTLKLEYLVPPGKTRGAEIPMEILKNAVLWQNRNQKYEYRHNTYRTICMEKSNFGGMENTGNTTIVTDAALVDEFTSDSRLEYAHGVIIHEFEHNECGSDVTMETPFDMWLNEAYTVDVERRYMNSKFDPDYRRLEEVDRMRAPVGGPLAIEDTGLMGNIVREGFNHPDELVDGVTYVKAAEVIRMLRLIIGEKAFLKARNLYFHRYTGSNANTRQFFQTFEEASGTDLSQFQKEWLHTIGYPQISGKWAYEKTTKKLYVTLDQTRSGEGGLFHLPLQLSAVDENGKDIHGTELTLQIKNNHEQYELDCEKEPSFVSFNRNCSFYGTFNESDSKPETLALQVEKDSNGFNRAEAMRKLTDLEKIKLIRNPNETISALWRETYGLILQNKTLNSGLTAHLLRIEEQTLDRQYLPLYQERYKARVTLIREVASSFTGELLERFKSVDTYRKPENPRDGIEERILKGILLRTLIELDSPETQELALKHFKNAWNITDKINALVCINLSSHKNRREILRQAYLAWKDNISGYSSYLSIIGRGRDKKVFDYIMEEEERSSFDPRHPTLARALYLPLSRNNKLIWTDQGISWLTGKVIELSRLNEKTAILLVDTLQRARDLCDDLQPKVMDALKEMRGEITEKKFPSISGRIRMYLGDN